MKSVSQEAIQISFWGWLPAEIRFCRLEPRLRYISTMVANGTYKYSFYNLLVLLPRSLSLPFWLQLVLL